MFVTGVTGGEQLIQLLDVELILSRVYPDDPSHLYPVLTDVQRERLKPMRILLVDDSSVARRQLMAALDYINIPYEVCTNGRDALALMQARATQGQADRHPGERHRDAGAGRVRAGLRGAERPQAGGGGIILHTSPPARSAWSGPTRSGPTRRSPSLKPTS